MKNKHMTPARPAAAVRRGGPHANRRLAAVAALATAAALAGCGTVASTGNAGGTAAPASTPPQASQAALNAADVAYAAGMASLEDQSAALAALAAGHTAQPQVRQYAAQLHGQAAQARGQLRSWMNDWHQPAPPSYTRGATPPYTPGPGMMGPGMMTAGNWGSYWDQMSHGWDQMSREQGRAFNADWTAAMMLNHRAEIAFSQAELRSGTSPQARALARTILDQRTAGLARLQAWQSQDWCGPAGNWDHGGW